MLKTYTKFYYDYKVDRENNSISLKEGNGQELIIEVDIGSYTLEDFAKKISQALNSVGDLDYTVEVDRDNRKLIISSTSVFSLLLNTSSVEASSLLPKMGFTSDSLNKTIHISEDPIGKVYYAPFWLQSFVDSSYYKKAAFCTVNKSASGNIQVQKFGQESFTEFNIKFITDILQPNNSLIKNNSVQSIIEFLDFLIEKNPIEFIKNVNDASDYEKLILESTEFDSNGVGYKLIEMYGDGLPFYFETGILKFRVMT